MKKCLNCGIDVGGNARVCPLCQNGLTGEEDAPNWAPMKRLKAKALAYKIQLFIVLCIIVISLSIDFLMGIDPTGRHFSIAVTVGVIMLETVVMGFIRKNLVPAKIVTVGMLHVVIYLVFVSWYFGFLHPVVYYVIPVILGISLVANLVFSLIDTTDNALVYLLANILSGIASYIMLMMLKKDRTMPWTICLMISMLTFIAIVVFKGAKVHSEVEKRMNF